MQAQHVLEQYHQVANNLHTSTDRKQAETALTEINNMPEGTQIALLKALSKEHHTDAADVLLAINELSPIKSIRKEARRSLIRLEEARIYPEWSPPVDRTPAIQFPLPSTPPPLWEEPDLDEDSEGTIDLHGLDPQEVVTTFVESWVEGDFETAYQLLSSDSAIREGLSEEEWIEPRDAWWDEAQPGELEPTFIHEREPQESGLWLPSSYTVSRSATHKVIEAGWSIELDETPLSETLPELPHATVVNKETERYWFWTSYTLILEQDEWRIQSMTDEGKNAENLPIEELQKRIEEHNQFIDEYMQTHKQIDTADKAELQQIADAIYWRFVQTIYYNDALIKKLPLDRKPYEEAAARTFLFKQYERCIVYVEALAHRFTEQRGLNLRQLAALYRELSKEFYDEGDDERAEHLLELATEALEESLAVEDSLETHISVAEVLIEREERLDEAEDHLLQAKAMITEPSEEAHIELHLGEIAMEREEYLEALSHYQRVAEIQPDSASTWYDVAEAHKMLGNFEEAETSYKRAISLEPDNAELYFEFGKMFAENNQMSKAMEVIEEGLDANPDSTVLLIYLATMYLQSGDYRQAEIFIEKAERIDPESDIVHFGRQIINLHKLEQASNFNKLANPKKKKRR